MINHFIFVINGLFEIYFWLILVRCLLSFVPSVDWYKQPFGFIKEVTDLWLNLFRKIIPPLNGLDFSPIVAIIALQVLQFILLYVLHMLK